MTVQDPAGNEMPEGPCGDLSRGYWGPDNYTPACLSGVASEGQASSGPPLAVDSVGFILKDEVQFTFISPDRCPIKYNNIADYVEIAECIRNTGVPNYAMARFPLQSGLNIDRWAEILHDFEHQKLLQYLQFGFPLSMNMADELNNTHVKNHSSAVQYPIEVEKYISEELSHNALLGPADNIPFKHYHLSPLLTRPKPPDSRRVIVNLSHPRGHSVNSHIVGDRYDGHSFDLRLPTIDHIIRSLSQFDDPVLAKIDISRAFRNIRIDPSDALKLGISWENKYFIDAAAAFGWVHGTAAFELCTSAISAFLSKNDIIMYPYIDDCVFILNSHNALEKFQFAYSLIEGLGLPINPNKVAYPNKCVSCLGIRVDIDKNTISIEPEKIAEIHTHCIEASRKIYLTKRAFQSLLGKLFYIHKCVAPARFFMNRMLELFRNNSHKSRIKLSKQFFSDLAWFIAFLHKFNGITLINKEILPSNDEIYLDACL